MTSTTGRPRGPYAKTTKVRERILDACMSIFAQSGYRASTVKDVAEKAGMSERGLVHHFNGKAEMLTAVLRLHEERSAQRMRARADEPPLAAMIGVWLENLATPGLVELEVTLAGEATSEDHPGHDYYRQRFASLRDYLAHVFAGMQERGEITTDVEASALAAMLVGLVEGLQLQWLYDRESVDVEAMLSTFLQNFAVPLASGPARRPDGV